MTATGVATGRDYCGSGRPRESGPADVPGRGMCGAGGDHHLCHAHFRRPRQVGHAHRESLQSLSLVKMGM